LTQASCYAIFVFSRPNMIDHI